MNGFTLEFFQKKSTFWKCVCLCSRRWNGDFPENPKIQGKVSDFLKILCLASFRFSASRFSILLPWAKEGESTDCRFCQWWCGACLCSLWAFQASVLFAPGVPYSCRMQRGWCQHRNTPEEQQKRLFCRFWGVRLQEAKRCWRLKQSRSRFWFGLVFSGGH